MISIIVPIYNVEKYLPKCIESIINQTYTDLEILLIDDGSTDNSGLICDKYASIDNRIKVIHKKNGGVSSARNIGLNEANGNYIAFVDSDDYIEKNMYEKMISIINKYNVDIVSCNYNHVNEKIEPFFKLDKDEYINNKTKLIEDIFQYKNYDMILFNKLYKKYIWKNIRFPLGINLAEDLMMLYPTINLANTFYCLKETLYNKVTRENGLTNSKKINDYINNVLAYEDFLLKVKQNKTLDYKRIYKSCSEGLFRHYKHLLDYLYIYNNTKYETLKKEIEYKLINMYNQGMLSEKNQKKIFLLKLNTKLYKKYRILSNKWKKYRGKRK